jgi:hypothetical protein
MVTFLMELKSKFCKLIKIIIKNLTITSPFLFEHNQGQFGNISTRTKKPRLRRRLFIGATHGENVQKIEQPKQVI